MKFDYKHYAVLLDTLLEKHIPVTFPERNSKSSPRFLIRHDIDYGLEYLGKMPRIEHEKGVVGTYFVQTGSQFYNPFSTLQSKALDATLKLGHRLGLHFDCEQLDGNMDAIDSAIGVNISLLKARFGEVEAVSFHHPSREIISNSVKIQWINTYDKEDMRDFEYMSDSCQKWSKGDPVDIARREGDKSFHILSHPALWSESGTSFDELMKTSVLQKANNLYNYLNENARGGVDLELVAVEKRK